MKTQFTSGPWGLCDYSPRHIGIIANINGADKQVATTDGDIDDPNTHQANASLIAAAPDLLAFAEAFAKWETTTMDDDDLRDIFKAGHAAIAKATGEAVQS